MPLPKHSVAQTLEGFAENIRMLTPGLCPKLVDRVANEQCKRYKKLVEYRQKHLALLKQNSTCSNGLKCRQVIGAIGVSSECIVSVASYKRGGGGGSFNYDENSETFVLIELFFLNCAKLIDFPRFSFRSRRCCVSKRRQCGSCPIPPRSTFTTGPSTPSRVRMPHLLQGQKDQQAFRLDKTCS